MYGEKKPRLALNRGYLLLSCLLDKLEFVGVIIPICSNIAEYICVEEQLNFRFDYHAHKNPLQTFHRQKQ